MIHNIIYDRELAKYIDAEAEKLDISDITTSKAAELHRLFDSARDSLLALMIFARRAGVALESGCYPNLSVALNSLFPDEHGKRTVWTQWNGGLVEIDVDKIDTVNASRLALAEQFGVSEQVFLRYERRIKGQYGACVHVPCNHHGCSMTRTIGFSGPAEMVEAERRASKEIWYCHHHREAAFEQEGALSDELLPVLQKIRQTPGLTQKDTGAKRDDILFLDAAGLITVDRITHGTRLLCYRISLTDAGDKALDKLLAMSMA